MSRTQGGVFNCNELWFTTVILLIHSRDVFRMCYQYNTMHTVCYHGNIAVCYLAFEIYHKATKPTLACIHPFQVARIWLN